MNATAQAATPPHMQAYVPEGAGAGRGGSGGCLPSASAALPRLPREQTPPRTSFGRNRTPSEPFEYLGLLPPQELGEMA